MATVKFTLRPHPFSDDAGKRLATAHNENLTEDEIIDLIAGKGSTVSAVDARASLLLFYDVLKTEVSKGRGFALPIMRGNFVVKGEFDNSGASFLKGQNEVRLNLTKGPILREAESQVKVERIVPQPPRIDIKAIRNIRGMLEIVGYNIKIEGKDPACGLWLIGPDPEKTETKLPMTMLKNLPSSIVTDIPQDLAPGAYKVKVVTQFANSGKKKMPDGSKQKVYLNVPRTCVFEETEVVI